MNNKLLTEAIADAKAVKETAIANAKLSLEEAFTPHLKSMLSSKLQELDREDEDEDIEEEMDQDLDIDFKESSEDDDFDINELLSELEDEEDEIDDDSPLGDDEESENETGMDDLSEDDLKSFIEDIIKDMVSNGELELEDDDEDEELNLDIEDDEDEDEDEDDEDDDEELNLDIKDDEDEELNINENIQPSKRPNSRCSKSNESVQLREALKQINGLKSELKEINLLNAKLLYTNKIFKAKNLTEDKKLKVLKAFDNAENVNQVKLVFETLNEGLTVKTPYINNIRGLASKVIIKPKQNPQPIIESNDVYNRMRKLAGLI